MWIKLFNLPFECWSKSRVSSIVNDFGRYLRADNSSRNLLELDFFKCQVVIDDPTNIPKKLFITLGDCIVSIRVSGQHRSFRWGRQGDSLRGRRPNEGGDQRDQRGRQLARWVDMAEGAAEASVVGAGVACDLSNS